MELSSPQAPASPGRGKQQRKPLNDLLQKNDGKKRFFPVARYLLQLAQAMLFAKTLF